MRPTALEILRGVRALLLQEVLPEVTAPQLRTQVALAIGLLDAAAVELDDAPAVYAAERARLAALAADALPIVRRLSPDGPLEAELAIASAVSGGAEARSLTAQEAESARLLALLDALAALCDERAGDDDAEVAHLGARVRQEMAAIVARRQRWTVGGAPG